MYFIQVGVFVMRWHCTIVLFFISVSMGFAQGSSVGAELLKRADENMHLMSTDPDGRLGEALAIESEAKAAGIHEAEMKALTSQCIYYYGLIEFEPLMTSARKLMSAAKQYNSPDFQSIAKYYMFSAYLFNDLPDKAKKELDEGMRIVEQAAADGEYKYGLRNNYYIGYANYYQEIKDYENQLKYIRLSGEILGQLSEGDHKKVVRHKYYSNLAQVFTEMQQEDSARYYSLLSDAIELEVEDRNTTFMNRVILGEAEMHRGDYRSAVWFFQKAESIDGPVNHINLLRCYDNLIESYGALNLADSARLYALKKDSLRLSVSESQNVLLHDLLSGIEKKYRKGILIGAVAIILLAGVILFFLIRNARLLRAQEKSGNEYLAQNRSSPEDHVKLIGLLKEGDPSFMNYFHEVYPDFQRVLTEKNPNLNSGDIEFSALLKLQLPTDLIARYKHIAPKTVQNKRYLIRKKLDIPKDMDTYQWFAENV